MASLRIVWIVVCIGLLTASAQAYSGGSGTAADPYQIATAEDLIALGETPDDYDKHFLLTADIDLLRYTFDRAPIAPDTDDSQPGFQGAPFAGALDGDNHVVSNLRIEGTEYLGFFGRVGQNAVISDMALAYVSIAGAHRHDYFGGLAGENAGLVSNCHVSGDVSGLCYVGGLVGRNDGDIVACGSACSVKGYHPVGGLVGGNAGQIRDCYNIGPVDGDFGGVGVVKRPPWNQNLNDKGIGGLVGRNVSGSVSRCFSSGSVIGTFDVGGLVGRIIEGGVDSSFWDTEVSGWTVSAGGVGLTTAGMQDLDTYLVAGWDFVDETDNGAEDIWSMLDGQGYPQLRWAEPFPELRYGYSGGSGTAEDPYQIAIARDLVDLGNTPEDYDKHFILTTDIDLAAYAFDHAVIAPHGEVSFGRVFIGVFDGNGHAVRNLRIEGHDYLGLFGYIGPGGLVHDIKVQDVRIDGTGHSIGGLVGHLNGVLADCHVSGVLAGDYGLGGLVGWSDLGSLSECSSSASVTGTGYHIGGLLGYSNNVSMSNCHSCGSVAGDGYAIGGLIGFHEMGSVSNCSSIGSVSGGNSVGGLIGACSYGGTVVHSYAAGTIAGGGTLGGFMGGNGSSVSNCHAIGSVTGNDTYLGGFVGDNGGTISNCYSTGAVTYEGLRPYHYLGGFVGDNGGNISNCLCTGEATGDGYVGGFAGINNNPGLLLDCCCTNKVTGRAYVGGLVAWNNWASITRCYSSGAVIGSSWVAGLVAHAQHGDISDCCSTASVTGGDWAVGGLVGRIELGTVSRCYATGTVNASNGYGLIGDDYGGEMIGAFWDIQSSGTAVSRGGVGLPTSEMQDINTYLEAGWDFVGETENGIEDIWCIEDGQGYPYLPSAGVISGPMQLYSGGSGTADDPFLIATAWDLIALGHTEPDYDKHFLMVADIDLSGHTFDRAVIAPDANAATSEFNGTPFAGTFVGGNHVIQNLHFEGQGHLGLFGSLADRAMVSGVVLEDCTVEGQGGTVGALAGESFGTVSACRVVGQVTAVDRVGSLIGVNRGQVRACCAAGTVTGRDVVGGLIGYSGSDGCISNCYSTVALHGRTGLGGLLGYNDSPAIVVSCYSTGTVVGEDHIGGLVGHDDRGDETSGFWNTETSGVATSAGGLALTTAQMQDIDTYLAAGWDFIAETENGQEDIWRMGDGDYPRLWWETTDGD